MTQGQQLAYQLLRNSLGQLVLIDAQGVQHLGVYPVRAFPITAPEAGIALMNQSGKEVF